MSSGSTPLVDALIILALKEEYEYFVDALAVKPSALSTTHLAFGFTLPADRNKSLFCAVGYAGDYGVNNILPFAIKLIERLKPSLVVSLGISGLVDDDLHIGDVVIAKRSDDILYRSKVTNKQPTSLTSSADAANVNDVIDNAAFDSSQVLLGTEPLTTSPVSDVFIKLEQLHSERWKVWIQDSEAHLNRVISVQKQRQLVDEGLLRLPPAIYLGSVVTTPWVGATAGQKRWLKTHDRNYLAMDMESYGVLKAVRETLPQAETLVVRGISDPSDDRKKTIDQTMGGFNRRWAMSNATSLLKLFLQVHWSQNHQGLVVDYRRAEDELAALVHSTCVEYFLSTPFKEEPTDEVVTSYSRVFSLICDGKISSDWVVRLTDLILVSTDAVPLHIDGDAGSGKSSLLSLIYWRLRERFLDDRAYPLPVFVDLHYYNSLVASQTESDIAARKRAIKSHLKPLSDYIADQPDHSVILILDGYDELAVHKDEVLAELHEIAERSSSIRIVGSRESSASFYRKLRMGRPFLTRSLASVPTDSSVCAELIEAFAQCYKLTHDISESNDDLIRKLKSALATCKIKNVDLFDFYVLSDYQVTGSAEPVSIAEVISNYCERFVQQLTGLPNQIPVVAAIAFDYRIRDIRPDLSKKDSLLSWVLLNTHRRINDFLTASHVINEFLSVEAPNATSRLKRIPYVYQHGINSMAKQILNAKPDNQYRFVSALQVILEDQKLETYIKAQACYLAGRIETKHYRDMALVTLRSVKDNLKQPQPSKDLPQPLDTAQPELLLARTVYISLASLGDLKASDQYVDLLLRDPRMDAINRGFHLEYYQDQWYDPRTPLTSVDNLGPCPRTFKKLIENIRRGSKDNFLWEIEVVTLCSLAQKRHLEKKLSDDDRREVAGVLQEIQRNITELRNEWARAYVRVMVADLNQEQLNISSIFERYYKLKSTPRTGWAIRGIKDAESVAAHTYGTYLLALFFLPDSLPDNLAEPDSDTYSKDEIIHMLLVHDLAEAVTGDILPQNKSEESEIWEQQVYEELALSNTYRVASSVTWLADLSRVYKLWYDFENRRTYNARVAKDLDKLDNFAQLAIYLRDNRIDDGDNWRSSLRNEIKTAVGKAILRMLEPMFGDASTHNGLN